MSSQHVGMNTYNKILNSCRVENKPIGPKHHMYDGQLKDWVSRRKAEQGVKATPTHTNTHAPVTADVQAQREAIKSKVIAKISAPRALSLRERYEADQKKKMADALKVDSRVDHLKSVGNGL